MPGFGVTVDANDDIAVDHVTLKVDGQTIGTLSQAPWQWTTPTTLSGSTHHIEADAYDLAGNMASATSDVSFPAACHADSDCMSGQVCNGGMCEAGPGTQGGLGSTCTMNSDCASNSCANDGQGHSYCVTGCDVSASMCPSNFSCVDTGGGNGVCWPGGNDNGGGGSGGCNVGGNSSAPLLLGLGLGAALITRRRRR
jgi:hypothetical protein